jgi:hypothetical protein
VARGGGVAEGSFKPQHWFGSEPSLARPLMRVNARSNS